MDHWASGWVRQVQNIVRFIGEVESSGEAAAHISIDSTYCAGLQGIDAFSHLIVLYWLHRRDLAQDR